MKICFMSLRCENVSALSFSFSHLVMNLRRNKEQEGDLVLPKCAHESASTAACQALFFLSVLRTV